MGHKQLKLKRWKNLQTKLVSALQKKIINLDMQMAKQKVQNTVMMEKHFNLFMEDTSPMYLSTSFNLLDSLTDYKQIRYIKKINKLITLGAV